MQLQAGTCAAGCLARLHACLPTLCSSRDTRSITLLLRSSSGFGSGGVMGLVCLALLFHLTSASTSSRQLS